MADTELPQIYLVTPSVIELSSFPDRLARVLDHAEIACLRLALASNDEDTVLRSADVLREVAHARDVAIVISQHIGLVDRLGLDGVHLTDGTRQVRQARKDLGADAIVGSFCGASKHDAMTAAEHGADYVSMGPVGASALGDGTTADPELFAWWSEMIETPIVAEGNLSGDHMATLAQTTDFFGIGDEIWSQDDPLAALQRLQSAFT